MKSLKLPKSGKIKKIIHISDIHIRSGDEKISRFTEYESVFSNLYKKIVGYSEIINNTAVIIITGDTFHHKCKIESPGILLFNSLIYKLSTLAPIYIILGNHDFKQDQSVTTDFLQAFLKNSSQANIEYLNDTGLYKAGDIGFGLVDIKDALHLGSGSGIANDLVHFPIPDFDDEVHTKIALFHGTMNLSKLNDFREATNGYAWEWLDVGYDLALLGDIHKHQVFKRDSGLVAAYAGSLIQQNFGENIRNHGILEWTLIEKKWNMKLTEIQNEYGLLKLNLRSGKWICEDKELKDIMNWKLFPKNLKVRLVGSYALSDLQLLESELKEKNLNFDIEDYFLNNDIEPNLNIENHNSMQTFSSSFHEHDNDYSLSKFMENNQILDYLEPSSDMFEMDLNCLGNEIKNVMNKKNQEFSKDFEKYVQFIESLNKKVSIRIGVLEWCGLLCYKSKNWFNFSEISQKTNLLSGENASGKTSFLEIINIALFGKSIPSRKTKSFTKSIICNSKTENINAYTKIDIYIHKDKFQIVRIFDNEGKPKQRGGGLFKYTNNKFEKLFSDASRLNSWVSDNIGEQDFFLMTNMLTQNNDNDILNMNQKEQREHLEKVVGITKITKEVNLYKIRLNQYKQIAGLLRNSLETMKDNFEKDGIDLSIYYESNESEFEKLHEELQILRTKKNEYKTELHSVIFNNHNNFDENFSNLTQNELIDLQKKLNREMDLFDIKYISNDQIREKILKNSFIIDDKYNQYDKLTNEILNNIVVDPNFEVSVQIPLKSKEDCTNNITKFEECKKNLCELVKLYYNNYKTNTILEKVHDLLQYILKAKKDEIYNSNKILTDFTTKDSELSLTYNMEKYQDLRQKNVFDLDKDILILTEKSNSMKSLLAQSKYENKMKPFESKDDLICLKQKFNDLIEQNKPFVTKEECTESNEEIIKLSNTVSENDTSLKLILNEIKLLDEQELDMKDLKTLIEFKLKKLDEEKVEFEKNLHLCKTDVFENVEFIELNRDSIFIKKKLRDGIYAKIKDYDILENSIRIHNESIDNLTNSIDRIQKKTKDIPYNHLCKACQQQPFRLQLQDLYKEIEILKNERELKTQELEEKFFRTKYNDVVKIYEKLNNIITKYERLCQNKDELYKFKKCLENIDTQLDHVNAICAVLLSIQESKSCCNKKYNLLYSTNFDAKSKIQSYQSKINKYNLVRSNLEIWRERLQYAEDSIENWNVYDEDQNVYEKICNLKSIDNDLKNLIDFKSFMENKQYIQKEMLFFSEKMKVSKQEHIHIEETYVNFLAYHIKSEESLMILEDWKEYEAQIDRQNIMRYLQLKNEIQKLEKYEIVGKKLRNIDNFLKFFNQSQIKNDVEYKLETLNNLIIEREVQYKVFNNMYSIGKEKLERYNTFLQKLRDVDNLILNIESKMKVLNNYRTKTFDNVIPLLERYTNKLLSSIDKNLKVICTIFDDGLFKFSAFNGFFQIPIEKTSGFERSIISLCLRLAFVMLTIEPNKKCGQLFIDEAFVNCDRNHLSRIPDFLNFVLNFFESILLVSHIDIIKDSVDNSIEISNYTMCYGKLK